MTSEKSNKAASPAEPADEMSGDEMYAAAIELPYDDPRKAYLEHQMRKLYGSVKTALRQSGRPLFPI
jgi:hypothetical protein